MFKYLPDIPLIPESLIPTKQELLDLPLKEKTLVPRKFYWFTNKHCVGPINEWLHDTFKVKVYTQYQFMLNGLPIHRDAARYVCVNYILHAGGVNAATNFYADDRETVVHSEVIKEKAWHSILTYPFHTVVNIDPDDIRISISCTPVDERQFAFDTFGVTV